jgi:tartrate dehydrogenase/decarboxylase/D-malate dehydrogenase
MPGGNGQLRRARHRVAVIGGDGIGPEVVAEGIRVLEASASLDGGFGFAFTELPWGSSYYLRRGRMMPPDGLARLRRFDAVYLGAVGDPRVPDHVTLWGLLLPIRQGLQLSVNLRPLRLLPGVTSPLRAAGAADLDMVFVRENTEGEYAGLGGSIQPGTGAEVALQISVFSRARIEQVARFAFGLARGSGRSVTSVSKGNALNYSAVLWDEVVAGVAAGFPDVPWRSMLVDAAALEMVLSPASFQVVVGSNLFADILSDLGAAIVGGLGLAPSANLCPGGPGPAMFEPVHGSAPTIAGLRRANPVAAILTAAMLLDHLGHHTSAQAVVRAVDTVLSAGLTRTPDLGGNATTSDVTDAVIAELGQAG